MNLTTVCTVVGALVLARFLFRVSWACYKHFFRAALDLKKYGSWAIVTGCTDGIGKAIAFELARKGMNLVLISRTQSKLDDLAKEIQAKGVQTQVLAVDYSNFTADKRAQVKKICDSVDVGVLVNNVGMSYPSSLYYHELEEDLMDRINQLNCTSVTAMTYIALPKMLERKTGCVVSISSGASLLPMPLLAGYGASKSYVNDLTESLAKEYTTKGISFSAQCPLYVVSKLSKMRKPSITVPSPETYAKHAVKHFGYPGIGCPIMIHDVIIGLILMFPKVVQEYIIWGQHASIRKRYLKKKAKLAKGE